MNRGPLALALVLALGAHAAYAEAYSYRLDPAATGIHFLLDAVAHKVRGTAALVRGEIRFDSESGAASGEVVVDAASLETGNAKRDRDMHEKVLESERFPEIVLVLESFDGDFEAGAASEVTVSARLRIHGDEHPLRLELALAPDGDRLRAATSFVVPYVEWGMKNPSKLFLRVAKEVAVTIDAAGTLSPGR